MSFKCSTCKESFHTKGLRDSHRRGLCQESGIVRDVDGKEMEIAKTKWIGPKTEVSHCLPLVALTTVLPFLRPCILFTSLDLQALKLNLLVFR